MPASSSALGGDMTRRALEHGIDTDQLGVLEPSQQDAVLSLLDHGFITSEEVMIHKFTPFHRRRTHPRNVSFSKAYSYLAGRC